MILRGTSSHMPYLIDRYRTGNYGEDANMLHIRCSECGREIGQGNSYYALDDSVYCMNCKEYADAHILKSVRDEFIYVL